MFKDRFMQIIQNKDLTAYKVAKGTGISQGLMSEYKNGVKIPTVQNLVKIADYLDCSVDYLLGRTDCPELATPSGGAVSNTADINLIKKYRRLPKSLQTAVNQILNSYDDLKTDSSETLTQSNDISTDAANVVAEGEKIFGKTHTDVK